MTSNSFLATSNAILYAGVKPIFVDIAEDGNIDLDICEKALQKEPTTKAIYPVAFSGNIVDQKKLKHLRDTYTVTILEDSAHAMGRKDGDIRAAFCTNSDISIFSSHPVKHMTIGEVGTITTNIKEIYEELITLRGQGIVKIPEMNPWEYEMRELGGMTQKTRQN